MFNFFTEINNNEDVYVTKSTKMTNFVIIIIEFVNELDHKYYKRYLK